MPEISCVFHSFYVHKFLCVCVFVCVVPYLLSVCHPKQLTEEILKKVRKTVEMHVFVYDRETERVSEFGPK